MIANPHTWIEISASAFSHNVRQFKNILGSHALALIIKADAYGHGLAPIAQLCEHNNAIDWLCTFSLSEALQARKYTATKPLLVLGMIDVDPSRAINQNIAFIVSDYQTARNLNDCAQQYNSCFKVHVKIDTGLSRFGITPQEALPFVTQLQQLPHININGICSHFAQSPSENQTYSYKQLNSFNTVLEELQKHTISIPFKHIANSAATTAYQLPLCNFFRVGTGIYGYWPSQANKKIAQERYLDFTLKPILTWKTRIIQIRELPAGQSVGYDCTYTTQKKTRIAILPVGYYDGYNPGLSNKGYVRINNESAPIIGRVAMNTITVDVTTISAHIGDEVFLLGDYPDITGYDLASHAAINNVRYITTNIRPNIKRTIVT
ncbi:MAG: alanine racemase [bacterium]|nr:alanine racemase [bacterium]